MSEDRYDPPSFRRSNQELVATEQEPTFDRYAPFVPPPVKEAKEPEIEQQPEPKSFGRQVAQGAAAIAGGATGAALKYNTGMFGPSAKDKFQISAPGLGVEPLSPFQLGTRQGQVTEEARQNLQMLLAKTQGAHALHGQEAADLRNALERAIQELPEASVERSIALRQLAEMGGVKAPRIAPLSAGAVNPSPDIVTQTMSAQTSNANPVSPLAKAMGQHEYEHWMKLARAANAQRVDDLFKLGMTPDDYARFMVKHGLHLPTQGGQLFVKPYQLMGLDAQPIPTTEERAAAEAAQAQAQSQAEAARRAEVQRAIDAKNAQFGFNSADKRTANLQNTISNLEEKYAAHVGRTSPTAVKLAPEVELAQQALLTAREGMPNALGYAKHGIVKSLPLVGGALSGASALEMGYGGYDRATHGDPIGSAISGAGSALSAASMHPYLTIPAGLGALGAEGLLMLYDKFGPSILKQLEKNNIIPKDWNPANFSVMDAKRKNP